MRKKSVIKITSDFYLAWDADDSRWGDDFGEQCAFEFDATIRYQKKEIASTFSGQIIQPELITYGDFYDVCDSYSSDLWALAEEIMGRREELASMHLFYLERMIIKPEFRGQQLGIAALRKIAQVGQKHFDVEVCALKPFPLQHRGPEGLIADPAGCRRDTRKLTAYYRKHLPIRPLRKGSSFYIWELK